MTSAPVLILNGHPTQAFACVPSFGRAGRRTLVASLRRWPLSVATRWSDSQHRVREDAAAGYAGRVLNAWVPRGSGTSAGAP